MNKRTNCILLYIIWVYKREHLAHERNILAWKIELAGTSQHFHSDMKRGSLRQAGALFVTLNLGSSGPPLKPTGKSSICIQPVKRTPLVLQHDLQSLSISFPRREHDAPSIRFPFDVSNLHAKCLAAPAKVSSPIQRSKLHRL